MFEEAGYSLFGPLALNIAAPDEGNMHLLEQVADPEQKQQLPAPARPRRGPVVLRDDRARPGAGSDPSALTTRAARCRGGWRINGRKWFITGADGAGFTIVMARTSGEPGDRGGATMFLVPADSPGIRGRPAHRHPRPVPCSAGTARSSSTTCSCRTAAVLGEVDQGFEYAQVRLGPARMTHCMRWLGAARRAQDIAVAYVRAARGRSAPGWATSAWCSRCSPTTRSTSRRPARC